MPRYRVWFDSGGTPESTVVELADATFDTYGSGDCLFCVFGAHLALPVERFLRMELEPEAPPTALRVGAEEGSGEILPIYTTGTRVRLRRTMGAIPVGTSGIVQGHSIEASGKRQYHLHLDGWYTCIAHEDLEPLPNPTPSYVS
jgi:hypothetical protein